MLRLKHLAHPIECFGPVESHFAQPCRVNECIFEPDFVEFSVAEQRRDTIAQQCMHMCTTMTQHSSRYQIQSAHVNLLTRLRFGTIPVMSLSTASISFSSEEIQESIFSSR